MAGWTGTKIDSPTGAVLNAFTIAPAGKPKAIVQINHGLAEHAARYQCFAEFLASNGYGAIVHDHRGHGSTRAPDAPLGHFGSGDGLAKVLADIGAAIDHASETSPGVPVVCFGHSLGGILALNHALRQSGSISALAVWNNNIQDSLLFSVFSLLLKVERMFKGSDTPSAIANKLTFKAWNREFAPNRTDFDWLSRDESEVDKYGDPLCGFEASVGCWLEIMKAVQYGADSGNWTSLPLNMPVNLVGGGADPYSEHGAAMTKLGERLQSHGMNHVTTTIYPDARHESLNEINRDQVMADFLSWLDGTFPD